MPLFCYWIFGSVNLFAGYLVQRRHQTLPGPIMSTHHHLSSVGHNHHINSASSHTGTMTSNHGNSSGNKNSNNNNNNNNQSNTTTTQNNNVNGMGAFLFIYCVPSALLMIAVFYEFAHRDIWLNDPQPSPEPMAGTKAPMWPFMLRAFMELLVGVLASGWTLGPRFATIWKSRFGCGTVAATPVKCKPATVKYPQTAYSTTSYQTVCPQNSMVSIAKIPKHGRKYPPSQVYRKSRAYKASSQSISLTGNETVL